MAKEPVRLALPGRSPGKSGDFWRLSKQREAGYEPSEKINQPEKHSTNGLTKPSNMSDLIELFHYLEKVKQQARALGIFTDDRELLACPSCGLLEDVTAEGILVTYPKDIKNVADTGLRFCQLDTESFQCPACGATCHLPTEE